MKKTLVSVVLASFLGLGLGALNAAPYDIDASHSSVTFKLDHMLVSSVDGSFDKFSGTVDIDPASKTLKALEGEVEISSINTKNQSRDKHLNAADFFDSAKFPKGTLKATKITQKGKDVTIEADLTLRDVTKKVTLKGELKGPGQNPMTKKELYGLTLNGEINRKDFNVGADTSNATVGDKVAINIALELHAK